MTVISHRLSAERAVKRVHQRTMVEFYKRLRAAIAAAEAERTECRRNLPASKTPSSGKCSGS